MKKIRVLYVEDETIDQMSFSRIMNQSSDTYDCVIASCIADALEILEKQSFDIILSDFMLADGTAFDLLALKKGIPFIVATGKGDEQMVVDLMKAGAVDYLIKDTKNHYLKMLPMVIQNIIKNYKMEAVLKDPTGVSLVDHDIYVKVNTVLVKLNTREIAYIEALANYVTIYTDSAKYIVHTTMKGIEAKLPSGFFMRVHLSFIVRLDKISKIDENMIVINNKLIPVSRSNKAELMNRLKVI